MHGTFLCYKNCCAIITVDERARKQFLWVYVRHKYRLPIIIGEEFNQMIVKGVLSESIFLVNFACLRMLYEEIK
jgi:hypothetical protein